MSCLNSNVLFDLFSHFVLFSIQIPEMSFLIMNQTPFIKHFSTDKS